MSCCTRKIGTEELKPDECRLFACGTGARADNIVWNITKDKIVERMTISPDQAWLVPGKKRPPSPIKGMPDPMTDWIKAGAWDVQGRLGQDDRSLQDEDRPELPVGNLPLLARCSTSLPIASHLSSGWRAAQRALMRCRCSSTPRQS